MPRDLKVFISSPGDVLAERNAADRILGEIQRSAAWRSKVTFQVIRWDDPIAAAPMDARLPPQSALNTVLPVPSACDITVVILWSRLGTLLADLHKADGRAYGSGTEWEFCDALKGSGGVYLFNNPGPPTAPIDDPLLAERQTQYKAVRTFIAGLKAADGANRHSYRTYSNVPEFEKLFEETIEGHLRLLDERRPLVQPAEASGVLDARLTELLKGIELVDDYKAAHDQLHRLQLECFGQIDCNLDRIGESDQRWDELSDIADTVDDVVGRLAALESRLAPARPGFKLAELKKGADLLRESVSGRDPLKLRECRNTLASILRRFPSQVVVEMNSAAQKVTTELAALRGRQPGTLEDVGKELERLIRSHDRWQRLDFWLSTTNPETQGVDSWWPSVQDLAESLVMQNPDTVAVISRVRTALEELSVSITQNAPAIGSKFQTLKSRTGVAFNRVDSDLKSYCTELRRVDGQFGILRHAS